MWPTPVVTGREDDVGTTMDVTPLTGEGRVSPLVVCGKEEGIGVMWEVM